MNAIESIKEQVSAIVVFTAITLDECYDQDDALCDRITEALDRMEKSKVFTKAEIDDVASMHIICAMFVSTIVSVILLRKRELTSSSDDRAGIS